MLYEMTVGKRPFRGETATETLLRVVESDPEPPSTLREDLPPELDRVIRRCLRKKPDERFNDTRDLVAALKDLQQDSRASGAGVVTDRPRYGSPRRLMIGSLVAVILIGAGGVIWKLLPEPRPAVLAAPQVTPFLVGQALGSADWSPLGNLIAYESTESGNWDLWICDDTGSNPLNLTTGSEGIDRFPAWSPDGKSIAFYSDRDGPGIYTMTATGGERPQGNRRTEFCCRGRHP